MIADSFSKYKETQGLTTSSRASDLTPYINYVKLDTASLVDHYYGATSQDCSADVCLKLHNGGTLLAKSCFINGTTTTNAVTFYFDPDGTYSGSPTGEGKSLQFWLYYNGRLTSRAGIYDNSTSCAGSYSPITTADPPWFSWN